MGTDIAVCSHDLRLQIFIFITSQDKHKTYVTYGNIFHGKDAVFTRFFRTFVPIQKAI